MINHQKMAKVELLAPIIFKWEGGFTNDPNDYGGATNHGVTLACWRQVGYDKDGDGDIDEQDIRLLSLTDATRVLKKFYWDRWRGDEICNQSIADILVDWLWCSGKWGIVIPQRILSLKDDGIVGPTTLEAVCNSDQRWLHSQIVESRKLFFINLIQRDPSQQRFHKGWLNRLNEFQFKEL
jgi:lysozyme family protein